MKKVFLISFVTIFLLGAIQGAEITISQPTAGQRVARESTLQINWTSSDVSGPLRIILRREGSRVEVIQRSTENDGNHPWLVPASLPDGSYFIRITTTDPAVPRVVGDSPNFNIAGSRRTMPAGPGTIGAPDSGPRPSLAVLSPDGRHKLSMNSRVRISWTADNIPEGKKLGIDLFQNKDFKGTIEWDLDRGRLSHVWTVGELKAGRRITPGSGYKIKIYIQPKPPSYQAWSNMLRIEEERTVDLMVETDINEIRDDGRTVSVRMRVSHNRFSGTLRDIKLYYYLLLDNPAQTLIDTKVLTCLPLDGADYHLTRVIFEELSFEEYANIGGRNRPRRFILKAVIDPTDSARDINRANNTSIFRFRQ